MFLSMVPEGGAAGRAARRALAAPQPPEGTEGGHFRAYEVCQ